MKKCKNSYDSFAEKFKLFTNQSKKKSFSEILEQIAFDKFFWWLRHLWNYIKFETLVKNEKVEFTQIRKVSNDLNASDNALNYGQPLTPFQKDRIIQLQNSGVSDADIRVIVSSRYINKDGSIRKRGFRDVVALIAAWVFFFLVIISAIYVGLLIWLSPLSIFWKLLLSLIYAAFFLFGSHIYNTLGRRAWSVYDIVYKELLKE